jgi:hypothetical protein
MKTPMQAAAQRAANEFKGGRGKDWPWTTLRDEIIDAECMDQIRAAHFSGGTATSAMIMEFRDAFVAAIAKIGFER